MPESDLSLLIDAAEEAGRIANRYFQKDVKVWHKPDEAGPVTGADLAVDDMLRKGLTSARPDYGWLSEETTDSRAQIASGQPERALRERGVRSRDGAKLANQRFVGDRGRRGGCPGTAAAAAVLRGHLQ